MVFERLAVTIKRVLHNNPIHATVVLRSKLHAHRERVERNMPTRYVLSAATAPDLLTLHSL